MKTSAFPRSAFSMRTSFLSDPDRERDKVFFSTRVKISRSVGNFPFPASCSPLLRESIGEIVTDSFKGVRVSGAALSCYSVAELDLSVREYLFEQSLINRSFVSGDGGEYLLLAKDGSVSVMLNGDDHVVFQSCAAGLCADELFETLDAIEEKVGSKVSYAFSETNGFLASDPKKAGTGLDVSVMMHLPALVMTDGIMQISSAAEDAGFEFSPQNGSDGIVKSGIYFLSSATTLGETERETLERISEFASAIGREELSRREKLMKNDRLKVTDKVCRAAGLLSFVGLISEDEASSAIADVRFGVECGVFAGVNLAFPDELLMQIKKAHLARACGILSGSSDDLVYDSARAEFLRNELRKVRKSI